ncbi:MAG: hypothetical protein QM773_20080 [Hyphomonadaceae bacterium]
MTAHFRFMRGLKFCSMKITADVREYASKLNDQLLGMDDMSAEFAAVGGGLYVSDSGEKREAIDWRKLRLGIESRVGALTFWRL